METELKTSRSGVRLRAMVSTLRAGRQDPPKTLSRLRSAKVQLGL
jgi:hypothetical protein